MKTPKIKRYRLGVSRNFPTTHPKAGNSTFFVNQIRHAVCKYHDVHGNKIGMCCNNCDDEFECAKSKKIHTIRANFPLWEKRIEEVQTGRAVIELFYWEGKPRKKGSKQVVFATLDKDSGCGVQMVKLKSNMLCAELNSSYCEKNIVGIEVIAPHDGLSVEDFKDWFKRYDLSKPMAIIHFTKFRY